MTDLGDELPIEENQGEDAGALGMDEEAVDGGTLPQEGDAADGSADLGLGDTSAPD